MHAFINFTLPNKKIIWQLGLASLVSVTMYVVVSGYSYGIGFPLDDSWIHQTYARNLSLHHQWAFRLGQPSAGSTAPLWTILLSLGFLFKLAPYIWTYLLGTLLLWGLGLVGEIVIRNVAPDYQNSIAWVGLFLILEWHMVWSAASGMETLLHTLLITVVLGMLMMGSRRFMTLGLLAGLSVWVRPDGITLLGPVVVHALAGNSNGKQRWRDLSLFLLGFVSLFGPYLLFNLLLAGTPLPNTFYAKQAEYASWQVRPFLSRFGELSLQFFAGPSLALLPGAIGWFVISVRKRDWGTLAGMIWFTGYLILYMERLPVYQHGRYIMPAMPIYFLWGFASLMKFAKSKRFGNYQWMVIAVWNFFIGAMCVAFWLLGANAYAQDVALIESEMVVTANWVAENVPPAEIVAAHDIGALGYYDQHELLDLAGLISPEVVPFIRDEERLAEYLDKRGASYLVAFPDFYPLLSEQFEPVFVSNGVAPDFDGKNMVVFQLR